MEELKEKIKQMSKKQKEISIMAIIVIIFIAGRIIYKENTIKSLRSDSSSTSTSSKTTSSESSSTKSTSNSNKVTTSYQAISRAKEYAEYGLTSKIKSSTGLHSVRRVTVTDSSAKESGSYYEVTLKGNGSGYSDTYDTKFKTLTFDAKVKVDKKTGNTSITSVSARTK